MIFLFDNHFPPTLAEILQKLSHDQGDGHVVECVRDKYPTGDPGDIQIVNDLAKDQGILLTKDIGQLRKPLEREAIRKSGITIFYFTKSYNSMTAYEQTFRILKLWDSILKNAATRPQNHFFTVTHNSVKK